MERCAYGRLDRSGARGGSRRATGRALLLAAALGGAAPASAQIALPEDLVASDENRDGALQREEVPIAMLPDFQAIDLDHDGRLDGLEIREYRESSRPPSGPAAAPLPAHRAVRPPESLVDFVRLLDRDGDKRISREEAPPPMLANFARGDANGDGFIDLDEARAVDDRRAQSRIEQLSAGHRTLARTVTLMDTNGDGKLQRKEAPLRVQRLFEKFDFDRDGAIDVGEAERADAEANRAASQPKPR